MNVDITLFIGCVLGYALLHASRFRPYYYTNHLERGFGPVPPRSAFAFLLLVLRISDDELELHASRRTSPPDLSCNTAPSGLPGGSYGPGRAPNGSRAQPELL